MMIRGILRTVAAIALVVCISQIFSYLARNGAPAFGAAPSGDDLGKVLFTGPVILTSILKVAVGMLIIASAGWGLSVVVSWVAGGLKDEDNAE